MKATDATIFDILQGECQYRVPIYQRSYEWGKPQWAELWDDILSVHGERDKFDSGLSASTMGHFLGSLIRRPTREMHGISLYDLIDGQQRLVSLVLLSKAIIDVYRSLVMDGTQVETHPRGLRQLESAIFNQPTVPAELRTVILPCTGDRDAFLDIMNSGVSKTSDSTSIREAYKFFSVEFKRWIKKHESVNDKHVAVNAFVSTLLSSLPIALLTLDPFDDDYEIFESVNTKGMQLAESDKLRNYCFMHINSIRGYDVIGFHDKYWLPMEDAVSPVSGSGNISESLNKFMTCWTYMRTNRKFPEAALYKNTENFIKHASVQMGEKPAVHPERYGRYVQAYFLEMCQYAGAFRLLEWPASRKEGGAIVAHESRIRKTLQVFTGPLGLRSAAHPLLLYVLNLYLQSPGESRE